MKCYFSGLSRKPKYGGVGKGLRNFSVPELGLLYRDVVIDSDEVLLEFTSLLLLFEFMLLNSSLFKNISSFDLFGSNSKVLKYIKGRKKVPAEFRSMRDAIMLFVEQNSRVRFNFFEVSREHNASLFKINSLIVNMGLDVYVKKLMRGTSDTNKG